MFIVRHPVFLKIISLHKRLTTKNFEPLSNNDTTGSNPKTVRVFGVQQIPLTNISMYPGDQYSYSSLRYELIEGYTPRLQSVHNHIHVGYSNSRTETLEEFDTAKFEDLALTLKQDFENARRIYQPEKPPLRA